MRRPTPTPSRREAELGRFIADLARIAEVPASRISLDSRLGTDLGFDTHAFNMLAALLYECYELADAPIHPRPEGGELTVGVVFEDHMLSRGRR